MHYETEKGGVIDVAIQGGRYSHILAIRGCAAGKGMVFKPFTLRQGLVIIENWSSRLTDDST